MQFYYIGLVSYFEFRISYFDDGDGDTRYTRALIFIFPVHLCDQLQVKFQAYSRVGWP